jgi:hypothetical protein
LFGGDDVVRMQSNIDLGHPHLLIMSEGVLVTASPRLWMAFMSMLVIWGFDSRLCLPMRV